MNYGIYNEKLTIILVSFHSNHIIENLINTLEKNIRIIVVENSLNKEIKPYIEKKFKNVQVVIPKENLGNGGGINLGLSLVKTKFSLYLDPDIEPDKNMIDVLLKNTEKFKNLNHGFNAFKDIVITNSEKYYTRIFNKTDRSVKL